MSLYPAESVAVAAQAMGLLLAPSVGPGAGGAAVGGGPGAGGVTEDVASALAPDVEYRLREIVQEALKCMRHCKRQILTATDINTALEVRGCEPLLGSMGAAHVPLVAPADGDAVRCGSETPEHALAGAGQRGLQGLGQPGQFKAQWSAGTADGHSARGKEPAGLSSLKFRVALGHPDVYFLEDTNVDCQQLLNAALPPPPLEVCATAHWLALEGVQPAIPENVPVKHTGLLRKVTASGAAGMGHGPASAKGASSTAGPSAVDGPAGAPLLDLKPAVKHVLSKELQMYFETLVELIILGAASSILSAPGAASGRGAPGRSKKDSSAGAASKDAGAAMADAAAQSSRLLGHALRSVASDSGLHPLVPYFVHFIADEVLRSLDDLPLLFNLMALARALLCNPHVHLEPYGPKQGHIRVIANSLHNPLQWIQAQLRMLYAVAGFYGSQTRTLCCLLRPFSLAQLHQLVPPLLTCLLAKRVGLPAAGQAASTDCMPDGDCMPESRSHWALRDAAASLIRILVSRYGGAYGSLQARLSRTLLQTFLDPHRSLAQHYGAIKGILSLGPRVAGQLIVPNLELYVEVLEESSDSGIPAHASAVMPRQEIEALYVKSALLMAVGQALTFDMNHQASLHDLREVSFNEKVNGSQVRGRAPWAPDGRVTERLLRPSRHWLKLREGPSLRQKDLLEHQAKRQHALQQSCEHPPRISENGGKEDDSAVSRCEQLAQRQERLARYFPPDDLLVVDEDRGAAQAAAGAIPGTTEERMDVDGMAHTDAPQQSSPKAEGSRGGTEATHAGSAAARPDLDERELLGLEGFGTVTLLDTEHELAKAIEVSLRLLGEPLLLFLPGPPPLQLFC